MVYKSISSSDNVDIVTSIKQIYFYFLVGWFFFKNIAFIILLVLTYYKNIYLYQLKKLKLNKFFL
jgi:hypothetical protein